MVTRGNAVDGTSERRHARVKQMEPNAPNSVSWMIELVAVQVVVDRPGFAARSGSDRTRILVAWGTLARRVLQWEVR